MTDKNRFRELEELEKALKIFRKYEKRYAGKLNLKINDKQPIVKEVANAMYVITLNTLTKALKQAEQREREKAIDDILRGVEDFREWSESYKKVLLHRRRCKKWRKGFCLDCFGGGLSKFTRDFLNDEKLKKDVQGTGYFAYLYLSKSMACRRDT
jgi:hypothetical protein